MAAAILLLALLSGDGWEDFRDWFGKHGTPGAPADVLRVFSAALVNQGLSESEAQARIKGVQACMAAHPKEVLTVHFDRIYTWAEAPFSREPALW